MCIVKGFVLIRSMMNRGKSFTGQFDESFLLVTYVLGLEVLINSLYFPLYFYLKFNRYNTIYAYGQSKLANILHANELARRLKVLNTYKPSTIYPDMKIIVSDHGLYTYSTLVNSYMYIYSTLVNILGFTKISLLCDLLYLIMN